MSDIVQQSLVQLIGEEHAAETRPKVDIVSAGRGWQDSLLTRLVAPIDGASLVVFRIGFGLMLAIWAIDYLSTGLLTRLYVLPKFHFTYFLFDFVRPWPGEGMQVHFLTLCVLACCIACGFLYRLVIVLFALGFTYFFLLDRTNYQNHYYLLLLVSWVMTIMPLNKYASLDQLANFVRPSATLPCWCLWLLRFHIALPYVFGGLAKLHPDWLAGEPMRTHLALQSSMPVIGPYLRSEFVVGTFVWGGLLFDLAIVPLLLWRRSRILAYFLCVAFHLMNAFLFNIHVFPWFMIFATTIFFDPDWPRRIFGIRGISVPLPSPVDWKSQSLSWRAFCVLLATYCAFHVIWPLRHNLYSGDTAWTERGHYFSWRMMVRAKASALRYYVTDVETGETKIPNLRPYVTLEQVSKFSRDPEMILQFAHFLEQEYRTHTGHRAEVHALVLTSMNGRKPQLLIDPNIDLAREPLGFHFRQWILPLTEPLRKSAWSVDLREWERHVKVPPLKFVKPMVRPDAMRAADPQSHNSAVRGVTATGMIHQTPM